MSQLKKKLQKGEFVITAELCPPKGQDLSSFREKAKILKGAVCAVNITDNQRAIMRMCALVGAKVALEEGLEPILQITCRDRNRIAIQSDLLGAAGFGIENILVLTGDYVSEGDQPDARAVFDFDSVNLIQTIKRFNEGIDLVCKPINGKTNFFIGGAVNPCAEPVMPHRLNFEKKISAGAEYFQTQVIFDLDKFSIFMDYAARFPVKMIAGILPVASAKMAKFLNDNVPGVHVPRKIIERLEESKDPLKTGIDIAREQIEKMRSICHGVHIMTIGHENRVLEILNGN